MYKSDSGIPQIVVLAKVLLIENSNPCPEQVSILVQTNYCIVIFSIVEAIGYNKLAIKRLVGLLKGCYLIINSEFFSADRVDLRSCSWISLGGRSPCYWVHIESGYSISIPFCGHC